MGVAVGGPLLLLPSHLVAKDPPADLELTSLGGEARPLSDWLTTFHLATVALDPYTNESAWILPTATRILEGLRGSDARVNLLVTAPADDAKAFLGPLVKQFLVFVDADRSVVKALGLETLPAFVFIRVDTTVPAATEGWNPAQWRSVAATIAATTAWQPPDIPMIGDPGPFHGTPALASDASTSLVRSLRRSLRSVELVERLRRSRNLSGGGPASWPFAAGEGATAASTQLARRRRTRHEPRANE